jgi:hypothetical protein
VRAGEDVGEVTDGDLPPDLRGDLVDLIGVLSGGPLGSLDEDLGLGGGSFEVCLGDDSMEFDGDGWLSGEDGREYHFGAEGV